MKPNARRVAADEEGTVSSQATPTLSLKGIGASPGVAVGHAYILDRKRGTDKYEPYRKAMAKTESAYDAERIVDALNAAEAPV